MPLPRRRPHAPTAASTSALLAERLGMPLVADDAHGLWALGPETDGHRPGAHHGGRARARRCPTPTATRSSSSSLHGQKVLLRRVGVVVRLPLRPARVAGHCAPSWHPRGLEIVTVALDVDAERGPPVHRSRAHPSTRRSIDQAHVHRRAVRLRQRAQRRVDRRGRHDRAARRARASRVGTPSHRVVPQRSTCRPLPPDIADMLARPARSRPIPSSYLAMLDDWVEHGATSRYALVARRGGRALATPAPTPRRPRAAEFELGQHLHRAGDHAAAIPHWREAHRLVPRQLDLQAPGVELRGPDAPGPHRRVRQQLVRGHQEDRRRELLPATHTLTPRLGARVEGRDALSPGAARPRGTPRRRRTPG